MNSLISLGQGLLLLGTLLALFTSVTAFQRAPALKPLERLVQGQALCFGFSFIALILAFVRSDFSLMVVALNSAVSTPLIYKISAAWSHHEGSLLLWVFFMSLYQPFLAQQKLLPALKAYTLGIHSFLIFLFGVFIFLTSNPFARLFPIPLDGQDLNPLLQDWSVVFHPPLLYAGLQGFSLLFSLSLGILLGPKNLEAKIWAAWLRPWALLSTALLTGGITLGSFWAYYELGWGGWWFWDPVENISLLPWLVSIGLLHSLRTLKQESARPQASANPMDFSPPPAPRAQEDQKPSKPKGAWILFQGLTIYGLILTGLVMVRSGALTSVHGFAQDHERGLVLLFLVTGILASAYSLFLLRFKGTRSLGPAQGLQASGLWLQSLLFLLAAGILFLGTAYPMLRNLWSDATVHVGPAFYKVTLLPLLLPALVLLGILPFVEEGSEQTTLKKTLPLGLGAMGLLLWVFWNTPLPSLEEIFCYVGIAVGGWLTVLTLFDALLKRGKNLWSTRTAGLCLAHLGVSLFLLAASAERWSSTEWTTVLHADHPPTPLLFIEGASLHLKALTRREGPNYVAQVAHLHLALAKDSFELTPEKRFYVPSGHVVSESAQRFGLWHTYYVTMGEAYTTGAVTVTLSRHPLVVWIWISALLAALGLLLAAAPLSLASRK